MKKWPWLILVLVTIALDQVTKIWAFQTLIPYHPRVILPMLNFTLAFNTGAAFSFLSSTGEWHQWLFTGFNVVMSIVLTTWITRLPKTAGLELTALSLILAGALGNLVDRVRLGHVIDFIDVHYTHYHWPAFNLADSAICIGAAFLLLNMIKE